MENAKDKKANVNLYSKYKMFSWDMLFYYAISFLFFTQIKGISAADVVLAEAFYPLFKVLLLIPATILIEKIGKRKSLIIGNIAIAISTVTYLFATNFIYILIGQFFSAVGYIIKGICETNMLYDSLEKNEKRGSIFSKIDGKATSYYYYIDAISSAISGFLFAINGYLPIVMSLLINIYSVVLSFRFHEIDDEIKEKVTIGKQIKDLKISLKSMSHSSRLRNLLLFGAVFSGILSVLITLRSSLLQDIQIPAQYFGIIFGVFGIISGIAAKNQSKFHNKYRTKTLATLSFPFVISCIVLGICCSLNLNFNILIIIVLGCFLIQYVAKGPFYTLIRQYLNNFTNSSLRTKISSSYNLLESLVRSGIGFFVSFLLRYTNTFNVVTIVGCIATISIVIMLDHMRQKVGLKPDQYKEKDIKIMELK